MAITKVTRTLLSTGIVDNSNATAITIDSSENVGIGTGSPSYKLHVNGVSRFDNHIEFGGSISTPSTAAAIYRPADNTLAFSTANTERMRIDSSGVVDIKSGGTASAPSLIFEGDTNTGLFHGGDTLGFSTAGSEAMRIDSSGNVGIGATPKAYHSDYKAIDINNSASVMGYTGNNGAWLMENLYYGTDNNWKHKNSDFSALVGMYDGVFNFYNTASGTAGATATLQNRLKIDQSGNVGIGTSSPLTKTTIATTLGNTALTFQQTNNGTTNFLIGCQYNVGNAFEITPSTAAGGSTFNSPALVVDSSGNLIVGKTSTDFNTAGFHLAPEGALYSGIQTASASSTYHVRDTTNNTWEFYVQGTGTINATNTSIASLSDERLKENIINLETGLSEVMSLKPRRFDWKEGEGSGAKNVAGFIAQEVETVLPDLIDDFMHDDLDDAKSVKMGDMIPTLVKAIQEQQTIIDDLKTRIETLESA